MSTDVYAIAADLYRRAGWTDVLPLPRGQKWPPPTGFTGSGASTPTDADIEAWKRQHRAGNVALHLPAGFVGLDVDHYAERPGADTMGALEARFGPLPATWISTARAFPSGIRLYRVPVGTELHGTAGPGVDIIQRHHRYVCCWPSTNPKAGGAGYRWLRPDGRAADRPPRPEELPELPGAWITGLSPRKVVAGPVFVTSNVASGYGGAALDNAVREVSTAPAGQRNWALNGCAYSLGRLVGAGLIDRALVEDVLVGAAIQRGGETEARSRQIVVSGMQAGMAKPRRIVEFRAVSA